MFTVKREHSPALIQISNINFQFDEAANVKQECEIHIIDFAKSSKITELRHFDEFSFDKIKCEPELEIIDVLDDEKSASKSNEIYANFQRLKRSKKISKNFKSNFPCEFCGKGFKNSRGLIHHIAGYHKSIARKKLNIICDHCGKLFSTKPQILVHMRIHKSLETCHICGRSMKPICLKYHLKETHGQHSSHKCQLCEKIYGSKVKLKQHLLTHVKKFSCKVCHKKFSTSYRHREHMKWHNDKSIFSCNVCKRSFNRKYNLDAHMKIHNMDRAKSFKCEKCDFITIYSRRITTHMMKHERYEEREKKLKNSKTSVRCEICSVILAHKISLTRHMITVHPKNNFLCDFCGSSCKTKYNIAKHLRRFHQKIR